MTTPTTPVRRSVDPNACTSPCFTQPEALAAGVPWDTAIAVAEPRCSGGSGYYYTYEQFRDYYTSVGAADYTDTAWSQATVEQPPPLALPPTATTPPASPPNPSTNNLQFDLASILAQVSAATATAMSSELGPLLLASSTRSDEAARVKAGAMPVLTEATTRQPVGVREFIRNIRWQSRAASDSQQAAAALRSLDPAIVSRVTRHCRNENLPTTTLDEIEAVLLAVYPQPDAVSRVYEQLIGMLFKAPKSTADFTVFAAELRASDLLLDPADRLPEHFMQIVLLFALRSVPRSTADSGIHTTVRSESTGPGSFGGTLASLSSRLQAHFDTRASTTVTALHAIDTIAADYADPSSGKIRCGICNGHHPMDTCRVNPDACTYCSKHEGRVVVSHTFADCRNRHSDRERYRKPWEPNSNKSARFGNRSPPRGPGKSAGQLAAISALVNYDGISDDDRSTMIHHLTACEDDIDADTTDDAGGHAPSSAPGSE